MPRRRISSSCEESNSPVVGPITSTLFEHPHSSAVCSRNAPLPSSPASLVNPAYARLTREHQAYDVALAPTSDHVPELMNSPRLGSDGGNGGNGHGGGVVRAGRGETIGARRVSAICNAVDGSSGPRVSAARNAVGGQRASSSPIAVDQLQSTTGASCARRRSCVVLAIVASATILSRQVDRGNIRR